MTFTAPSDLIRRTVAGLRWWIAAVLFASTVINYVDRQTFSLLAPFLKVQYHWSNTDYAAIVIAFRVAYAIGQTLFGRLMDKIGTRRGLTLTVLWYSIVSILTPLASGLHSFGFFRFLLGAGESANWPAATKAVSEWFPKQERGLATAFFDSGSSVGGAIAPFIVLSIYFRWGWRPAVAVPGLLGFLWILLWRKVYQSPETHPRISDTERKMLAQDTNVITTLFALATFSYAAFSTIANVLPSDLFDSGSVASVSGLGGTGAGIGTILAFPLVGHYSDLRQGMTTHAFDPIIVVAGLIPFVGMILVLLLVRNTKATREGLVRPL